MWGEFRAEAVFFEGAEVQSISRREADRCPGCRAGSDHKMREQEKAALEDGNTDPQKSNDARFPVTSAWQQALPRQGI